MRLEIQLNILSAALKKIFIETSQVQNEHNKICINNISTIIEGLNEIENINSLNPELKKIREIDYFYSFTGKKLVLDRNNYSIIESLIDSLRYKLQTNINILNSIVVPASELTLCIKLIEYGSLNDIANELMILDKAINQVITHEKLKGEFKFTNFDVGTSWVYIIVNSMPVLGVIASVIWSASVIRKKIIEGNINNEFLKQMKLKTSTLEDIKGANDTLIKQYIETEAVNVMSEHNLDDTNHEYKERLIYAIKELSKLIIDGVEFNPAAISTEDVKNLFPNFDKLDLIESKTKLLENKSK
jgi:hypothetical protein